MYLSKLFLCLLPFAKQKPSWSLTKISKLVRDSALNVGVKWVKVRRAFGIVFVFFASLYLYIFVFCLCADTALPMFLSFSQPCQSAMRTTRTTTKIEKPALNCCWCAQNQCYFYFFRIISWFCSKRKIWMN